MIRDILTDTAAIISLATFLLSLYVACDLISGIIH
jgi:hypothetical protein